MAGLREAFADAGFDQVQTYLQSGNVVLGSDAEPEALATDSERLIRDAFGFEVPVIVRTDNELAEVVAANPLERVARNPKRYQVSFLSSEPDPEVVRAIGELKARGEELVAIGRELYAWHPDGVARSKLWTALAGKRLGVSATARNWSTVMALHERCTTT